MRCHVDRVCPYYWYDDDARRTSHRSGDLPPAHCELLESLSRQSYLNEKLQHQLEELMRRIYGRKSKKIDLNHLLPSAKKILAATEPPPSSATSQADPAPASAEPT